MRVCAEAAGSTGFDARRLPGRGSDSSCPTMYVCGLCCRRFPVYAESFPEDVLRSIDIPVVYRAACGTGPLADPKVFNGRLPVPADMAELA